ncbi:SDR family oxidoreductase [Amycolatopsis magusensis]|uniref:NAD(P)-dependent dehydrogenase (Short-subunit alcohol dehydrogenase family) n=1 Tax=Amycolatopsis magusensis TaxID=882444 RepID=A0ABS4PNI7_9PSEU|nr:SDR family oxidoreductase [Amycolatopsis magusensis]MBP2180970.1 NAD(P)-dependent dehydrogenase (short-subunit alcohol dehydrogenase family) [Amycolatopsis magusensis]
MNLELATAVAVVTGSNRGLGRRFAEQLLARGAKVYATARRPEAVDLPGAIPLRLDLGDSESIAEAARVAADATLLINNAGISTMTPLIGGDFADIRREMDTHYFGTLEVTRAFAPVLEANGGGAVLNVLSVLSWVHLPDLGAYSAAKTASWAMTNLVRQQLAPKGIHVAGLHVGYLDTDMAASVPADQKSDPGEVAALALDALAKGEPEIIADDLSRQAKAALSA